MREIKFRAFIKKYNEIQKVTCIDFVGTSSQPNGWIAIPWDDGYNYDPETCDRDCVFDLKDVELMQFTGLLDKNGNEIYEGNIVREENINAIWEVYYDEEEAWFWLRKPDEVLGQWNCGEDPAYPHWEESEIVGNIYKNPDLLRATK